MVLSSCHMYFVCLASCEISFKFRKLGVIKLKSMKLYYTPILFSVLTSVSFAQSNESFPVPNEVVTTNSLGQEVTTTTNIHFRVIKPSVDWKVIENEEDYRKKFTKTDEKNLM